MRITDSAIISDFLTSITRSKSRINRLNTQLANNKKILKVSDDPAGASTLLRLNEEMDRVAAYKSNVVVGKNILKTTVTNLDAVSDLIGEVKSILTGAVSSGDPSLLGQLAIQVDEKLSQALEIANWQFDGKYVFAGTQTTTPPFIRTGTPTQVSYTGDARSIQYQVGDGVSQVVNVSGAAAFNSTGFVDLTGVLDRNAALNTVVSQSVQITDGLGAVHSVVMNMRKTDANTWSISAGMPPGATDANLTGGTATVTFDPVTGAMKDIVRGAALVLSPSGATPAQTAPPISLLYSTAGVTEGTPAGGSTLAGSQRNVSLFNKMMEISSNLRSGVKPTAEDMALLSVMQDVVMREEAKAGAYSSNLEAANDFLTTQNDHLLDLYSAKQDVDLAEIAIRLKQEQLMLDAALSAAANLIPKSLVDFLT
jgi:flagellar hook-associated protein 3 FlgL